MVPCIFGRTFKIFVTQEVNVNRAIKWLDFVGAFCQGHMKTRLFLKIPQEYWSIFPENDEYFVHPNWENLFMVLMWHIKFLQMIYMIG